MKLEKLKQANQIYEALADMTIDEAMSQLNTYDDLDHEVLNLVKSLITNSEQSSEFFDQKVAQHFNQSMNNQWRAGMQLGGYELVQQIGTGGMSLVFKAKRTDSESQKPVAIKIFNIANQSPLILAKFKAEQDILADLSHPHIVDFHHGQSTPEGAAFLVMELLDEGLSIDEYVSKNKLKAKAVIKLVIQAAQALQHAHNHLIIHRDIKPSNLMVNPNGHVKLLDFGIAKLIAPETDKSNQAKDTLLALTPSFAAPEQINSERVDVTSDIYSLAAVAVQLLTASLPFPRNRMLKSCSEDESHVRHLLQQHLTDQDLINVLTKALKTAPESRYRSMNAFEEDLNDWLAQKPVTATPDTWWYRLRRFAERRTALFTTSLALSLTLLVAVIALSVQNKAIKLEAKKAQAVKQFMLNSFSITDPNTAQGIDISGQELLRIAASKINQDDDMDDQIKFELYESLAIAHGKLGFYPEAVALIEQALSLKPNEPSATVRLAEFLFHAGEIEQVNELINRTNISGFGVILQAEFLRIKINLLSQAGKHQEAFALYDHLQEMNDTSEHYLKNRTLLAEMYYLKGEAEESIKIIEALKQSHPLPDTNVFNLGLNSDLVQYLDIAGRYADAKNLTAQNIETYKKILGDTHPYVGLGYNALSVFQRLDGELKEALASAKISESIYRERYGDSSEGLAQALSNQGVVHHYLGAAEPAINQLSAAAEMLTEIFSPLHPEAMDAKANLAVILNANNRPHEALPVLEEIYAYEKQQYGLTSRTTLYTKMALALTYGQSGMYEKAVSHALENFSLMQQHFAENADLVNHSESILGRVYFMANDHQKALIHNLNHINNWTEGNKNNHARSLYLIGKSHFALQDYEAAKQFLEQWTQYLSSIYSATDELYLNAELERATLLIEMQEISAAKALITKVSDTLKVHGLNYDKTQNRLKELNGN
ncbi:protein kinase [Marinicella sp. S1101]|uniref:serine/threonine-protein kinase n=1 Tax=Marinicella marina TaxID=2996016 RepID=UPI002260D093|nr:serine/threonine-protein kinase [Marinicella marina]MCX7553901.1 protein kinase [Marinicella marina]MDJ1140393.1 protein kinase [Marinicella marina]